MDERKSRYELFLEEEARKAQPTKRCSKCKEVKALSEFYKRKDRKVGRVPRCKACSSTRMYRDDKDRFWKGFHARTQRIGDCIEWTGSYQEKHPIFLFGKKRELVRRTVYKLSCGELPDDMFVITSCDNLRCVRQSHLKKVDKSGVELKIANNAWARAQNRHTKGVINIGDSNGMRKHPERVVRGEQHGWAKLTEADIRTIYHLRVRERMKAADVADQFGVSAATVYRIANHQTWKHVQ